MSKKAASKKTKLICLIVCSVLLIGSLVGASVAWFRGIISAPGGTVQTAKISVSAVGYTVGGTKIDGQESPYEYENIYQGMLDGTNSVSREVKNLLSAPEHSIIITSEDVYTVLFVVQRRTEGMDIDVQLQLSVEEPDDDLGGFSYYFANVTELVDLSGLDAPEITDGPLDSGYETQLKAKFDAYLNSADGKLTEEQFSGKLANLNVSPLRVSISSSTRDYAVLRFSAKLDSGSAGLPQYSSKGYKINGELTVAQTGALTDEVTGATHDVHNIGELQDALKKYVTGDVIRILSPIVVSGDLNFPRPVRVEIVSSSLTVRGNFRFSYAYEGHYALDLSQSGQLIVAQESGVGGNLLIDTPNCTVDMTGSGSMQPLQGDIYCSGTIDVSVGFDKGLTVSRTSIYNTNSAAPEASAAPKGVRLKNKSRMMLSANSYLTSVEAYEYFDVAMGKTDLVEEVFIENYGEIHSVNLFDMEMLTEEQQNALDHPQIEIHNHSIIGSVRLPVWSTKWTVHAGTHEGNTRIVCYLGAQIAIDTTSAFDEDDVEWEGLDTEPVVPLNASGERAMSDEETVGYRVSYYKREGEDENSIQKLFSEWDQEHHVDAASITYLKITCYGLLLTHDDYAYIEGWTSLTNRTARADGKGFPNLQTFDLSDASSEGGKTPDFAFRNLKSLGHVDLPSDTELGESTTSRQQLFDVSAPIIELYLPETYTTVNGYLLQNIHYLHIGYTGDVVMLYEDIRNASVNFFLANDALVDMYRVVEGTYYGNRYREYPWRFSLESTHYGHVFAILDPSSQTARITAVDRYGIGGMTNSGRGVYDQARYNEDKAGDGDVQFTFDTLTVGGVAYEISEYYSYSFYRAITDLDAMEFPAGHSQTLNIGAYAFYEAGINGKVSFLDPTAHVTVGNEAFRKSTLQELTFGNASVGDNSFRECNYLTSLTTTGDLTTGQNAFISISVLRSVKIGGNVMIGTSAFQTCPELLTLEVDGAGEMEANAFYNCTKLVSAVCKGVTRLGSAAFSYCTKLKVADFPALMSARNSFRNCTSLEFARTGIITTHDNVTGDINDTEHYNIVFGYEDPVRLHLITAPAENPGNITLAETYTVFWVNENSTSIQMRVPLPDWLYQLYLQTNYGICSKYDSKLRFAHNTNDVGYEDWRYCKYEHGGLVECDPYEVEIGDNGVATLTLPDFVFYAKNGIVKLVACLAQTTEAWGDDCNIPGKIQTKDGETLDVTVIGDGCFSLTTIPQNKVVVPDTITEIQDRAFYIMRSPTYRGDLRYDFEEVVMNGVKTLGAEVFRVYEVSSTDVGFSKLTAPNVETIGTGAFRNNKLYTVYMPEAVELGAYAFQKNTNLYSAYMPKVERENNTEDALTGNQFAGCTQLRFVFVGPLARFGSNFGGDYASIFIDASIQPTTTAPLTLGTDALQRFFLRYTAESTGYDRYITMATADYTTVLVSYSAFEEDYIFGNDNGKQFEFADLFKYETWAGEGIDDAARPAYIYRYAGDELTLVSAHGKHEGEYTVPDEVGGEPVDTIGWIYETSGKENPDNVRHNFNAVFSTCDLSLCTKLSFGEKISKINNDAFRCYSTGNTYNLGRVAVNTNKSECEIDLTGLEYIGNYAFTTTNVTKVTSNDTEMHFGTYSLRDNPSLKEVNFPNAESFGGGVLATDGTLDTTREYCVFYGCAALKTVSLPAAKTVYGLLRETDYLETASLPKVEYAYSTFRGCDRLYDVTIGTEAEGPVTLRSTFYDCIALKTIQMGRAEQPLTIWDSCFCHTDALTVMKEGFEHVTKVDTNGLNTSRGVVEIDLPAVTEVGLSALATNVNLTTVSLGSDTASVKLTGATVFSGDTALITLDLPYVEEAAAYAFQNIANLETITLRNIKEMGDHPFYSCKALQTINIGPEKPNDDYEFTVPAYFLNETAITSITLPNVTALADHAFNASPAGFFEVHLPRVTLVGPNAFRDCASLDGTKVELGSEERYESFGVRLEQEAFRGCTKLGTVNWPYVTEIDQYIVFYADSITTFQMDHLQRITTNTAHNTSSPFDTTYDITKLIMPELTVWPAASLHSRTTGALTEVNIASLIEIPTNAFSGCANLKTVTATAAVTVNNSAFNGCATLTTISLPHARTLGTSVFAGCKGLVTIELPSVRTVGETAFSGTTALQSLTLGGDESMLENGKLKEGDGVSLGMNALWETGLKTLESDYVVRLEQYALRKTSLTRVVLNGVKQIDVDIFWNEAEGLGITYFEMKSLDTWTSCTLNRQTMLTTVLVPSLVNVPTSFCSGLKNLTTVDISAAVDIGNSAFNGCASLATFTGGEETKTIGSNAFNGCATLINLAFPKVKSIAVSAFAGTTNLTDLTLGTKGGVTSGIALDGATIFSGSGLQELDCDDITSIIAGAFNGSKIRTLKLNGLEKIDAAIFDNSFTTLVEVEMNALTSLTNITFENHKGSLQSVSFKYLTAIPTNCFKGCALLSYANIQYAETVGDSAFSGCAQLASLESNAIQTVGSNAFNGCAMLNTGLSFRTGTMQTIGTSAFADCLELTTIDLSRVQTIAASAFSGCRNLASVTLGSESSLHKVGGVDQRVELMGGSIFKDCTALTELSSDWVSNLGAADIFSGSSIVTLKLNKLLTAVTVANALRWNGTTSYLETVEMDALQTFSNNTFPTSVKSIKAPALENVANQLLLNYKELTSVDFSGATVVGSSAFSGCSNLVTAILSGAKELGGSAFLNCTSLQTVDIPNVTNIGSSAFSGCKALTQIAGTPEKGFNELASLTVLDTSAFLGCANLESISLPTLDKILSNTFQNCTLLSSVKIPKVAEIGASAFSGCAALETIRLDSLTQFTGNSAFEKSGLRAVNLPSLTTLMDSTFANCADLQQVAIGKNFNAMASSIFFTCPKLTQFIIEADATVFAGTNESKNLFGTSAIPNDFKVLVHYDTFDTLKKRIGTGNMFSVKFQTYFKPMESYAEGPNFVYYVSEMETVNADEHFCEVVYIIPQATPSVEPDKIGLADIPDTATITVTQEDGSQTQKECIIISVKPTAWSGLTEDVTKIVFPRRMTVFHTSSMLYMPESVAEFALREKEAGDSLPNYFQIKDGMLFDSAGWTLLAVPKAYQGKDKGKTVVIGGGEGSATADVNVISARAFYGNRFIERVFVVDKAIYINGEAFAYSNLKALWFTGKENEQVSYFIGSDIFIGTDATIYVPVSQRTRYAYRDVGSEYLLNHLEGWGDGCTETEVPSDYKDYIIEGDTHVEASS